MATFKERHKDTYIQFSNDFKAHDDETKAAIIRRTTVSLRYIFN